jgi:hypothetical protein
MIGAFVGVKYLVNLQNVRCNNKAILYCFTTSTCFGTSVLSSVHTQNLKKIAKTQQIISLIFIIPGYS